MPLHLLKLSVGCESIKDLEDWIAQRVAERAKRGEPRKHTHVTRMVPKRQAELLDGGSMYWVIKGQVAARQTLADVQPFTAGSSWSRASCRFGRGLAGRSRGGATCRNATHPWTPTGEPAPSLRCRNSCVANLRISVCSERPRALLLSNAGRMKLE